MPLITKEERKLIYGCSVLRDSLMEQTFDLVTGFYPDQVLTQTVREKDVVEIMNFNYSKSEELLKKIRKEMGKEPWRDIRVSDFCDYMDIDDLLVQVFLASLKPEGEQPPPLQPIAADWTDKPLRSVHEARKDLRQGMIIYMPPSIYKELNPMGEPMAKRDGFYRCIVRAYEVAQIYEIHIDTARAMLREVREEEGLPERAHVSISKFCKVHYTDEDDFRHSLASIHEDDRENDND